MQFSLPRRMPQVKSVPNVQTAGSVTRALFAEAGETPGKPSCPGCWEILVELGDTYELCILCGERREIGA